MSEQWFISREGERRGPYTWEEVVFYTRSGNIGAADLLWSESTGSWVRADQVPGLLPAAGAAAPSGGKKKKVALIAGGGLLVVFLIAAIAYIFTSIPLPFRSAGTDPGGVYDCGEYSTKEPDSSYLIETEDWGMLPANQIAIVLEDGHGETEAAQIAAQLDAEVVGRIEFINMYQLETAGTTEEDLRRMLTAAQNIPGVEIAAPNIPLGPRTAIEGRGCSPLNDPMYDGNNGRAYEMIGLQEAWDIIRATGVDIQRTRVGVIDRVIYTESGHDFSPELHLPDEQGRHASGKVRTIPVDRNRDLTAIARTKPTGQLDLGGLGHGTAVTHVVAADPGGGTVGVAGILGENLEVLVSVQGSGRTFVGAVDPDDPVRWNSYTYGMLERMLEQVENGATVINLSWGPAKLGPQNAQSSAMMHKFLRIMNERHPDVTFVGAAGNSGQGLDGDNDYWGKDLPNLITVGALNHDGGRAKVRDWHDRETLERAYQSHLAAGTIDAADTTFDQFVDSLASGSNYADEGGEVTLSASGTAVPVGIGPDGKTLTSNGTSFAAPQVVGAIALIRSINPNLSAADVKRILVESASRQVERDGVTNTVPANMGAGVMRVDAAVLQVINEMRAGEPDAADYPKLPPLDRDTLLGMSRVKLTAELQPGSPGSSGQEWVVTASVSAVGDGGTELQLKTSGQGMVSGSTRQRLNGPGEVSWRINVQGEHFTVRVERLDTNGCTVLELYLVELGGTWTGIWMMTHSDVVNNPHDFFKVHQEELTILGCEEALAEMMVEIFRELLNKEIPMTLELVPGEVPGQYSGSLILNFEEFGDDDDFSMDTQYFTASFENGVLTFALQDEDMVIYFEGTPRGTDRLQGTFTAPFNSSVIASGTWTVTRSEEQ